jgi:hypothetical protein
MEKSEVLGIAVIVLCIALACVGTYVTMEKRPTVRTVEKTCSRVVDLSSEEIDIYYCGHVVAAINKDHSKIDLYKDEE